VQVEIFGEFVNVVDAIVTSHLERLKRDVLTAYGSTSCVVGHFVNPTFASWYLDVSIAPGSDAVSTTVTVTNKPAEMRVSCTVWYEQDDVWERTEHFDAFAMADRRRLDVILAEFVTASPEVLMKTVQRLVQ
jgi:hypothetical protein